MKIKKGIAVLLAACTFLGVVGCSGETQENADKGEITEEFDIVLDWYPNAVHSFIYVAMEKGYYEEEGLKVNVRFPANTNDALSLTAAGKADAGLYYVQDVLMAKESQGVPVVSLGAVVQEPIGIFAAVNGTGKLTPADMKGKTIGFTGRDLSEAVISALLEQNGMTIEDINMIDVGFDLMTAMTTGNVDITYGCFVNHEVPELIHKGFTVDYFFPHDYGIPEFYGLVLVTGEQQVQEETDKLQRFIKASKRGFADVKENPEEALDILLNYQNEENFPLTREVEQMSMDYLIPVMEMEDRPFLSQNVAVWQENADWLLERGLMNQALDASTVIANLVDK